MNKSISGCILAGGKSSRFNYVDKALLPYKNDKTLIEFVFSRISEIFENKLIIANKDRLIYKKMFSDAKICYDIFKDCGPLAGIHAALFNTKSDAVFVFACDMPNISGELIINMIQQFKNNQCDILVPFYKGKYEPLFAIYSKSILLKLHSYLSENYPLKTTLFFDNVNTQKFIVDEKYNENLFLNINSEKDLLIKQ